MLEDRFKTTRSEQAQIRLTLSRCLAEEDLVCFIESDKHLKEHLSKRDTINGVGSLSAKAQKLVEKVADRIYELRNRLVHAKSSDASNGRFVIVPDSDEIEHLTQEVKLVRYAAQSVTISSSTRWQFDRCTSAHHGR